MNDSIAEEIESRRLHELKQYDILDSVPEADYADVTELASLICEAPMAIISFIDKNRQWLKSRVGLTVSETKRIDAFCAHTIQHPKEMMVVPDARKDARFQNNPYVTGEPNIVFYAGMPLTNKQGYALGAVCVLDTKPRVLSGKQIRALKLFSIQVVHMLELRRIRHEHQTLQQQLHEHHPQSDAMIASLTDQIRLSLSDVLKDKPKWESWYREENKDCAEKGEQMEIGIKSLIEKLLPHYTKDAEIQK